MEKHDIEYKEQWKDEYLKWICGFANAQGGTISEIGGGKFANGAVTEAYSMLFNEMINGRTED